ncbi:hypothetical protein J6590_010291 [Homalodisca vitripennis]|nr:hypothetical protein J6590_010291 [Homalodisca vitripennis]
MTKLRLRCETNTSPHRPNMNQHNLNREPFLNQPVTTRFFHSHLFRQLGLQSSINKHGLINRKPTSPGCCSTPRCLLPAITADKGKSSERSCLGLFLVLEAPRRPLGFSVGRPSCGVMIDVADSAGGSGDP